MKKYKFKVGDKVRIKSGVDLERITIGGEENIKELMSSELTIDDATPGQEKWRDKGVDGTPTYSIDGWRIPESFLIKS